MTAGLANYSGRGLVASGTESSCIPNAFETARKLIDRDRVTANPIRNERNLVDGKASNKRCASFMGPVFHPFERSRFEDVRRLILMLGRLGTKGANKVAD